MLVFKTSKLVCNGATTNVDACDSFRLVLDIWDFPLILVEFAKVQNYVCTNNVEHSVDLHIVYEKCRPNACYEPEACSERVYKIKEHPSVSANFSFWKIQFNW